MILREVSSPFCLLFCPSILSSPYLFAQVFPLSVWLVAFAALELTCCRNCKMARSPLEGGGFQVPRLHLRGSTESVWDKSDTL